MDTSPPEAAHRPSVWQARLPHAHFSPLSQDLTVDVAVIGGGLTGLTAALMLSEARLRVAVLEARRLGGGVSSATTAHATAVVDKRYRALASAYGEDGAQLVAASSTAAIHRIEELAARHDIACGFLRRPGHLFAERADELAELEDEVLAARRAGLTVEFVRNPALPFPTAGAMRLDGQAQFHAGRYLAGLYRAGALRGVSYHEGVRVVAVEDGEPCFVHTEDGPVVRAKAVFAATHAPTVNRVLLQTKLAAYRSYVVACRGVTLADGLYWDMASPYHYFSTFEVDGETYLLVGGEDHKTGQGDADGSFGRLLGYVAERFGARPAEMSWSGQVECPVDGLPFIGRNSASRHVYVAAGFAGNGTTFGTLAADIVSTQIRGHTHPWEGLYDATRVKPVASAATYLKENVDFPIHLFLDRFSSTTDTPPAAPGEGAVMRLHGRRAAVTRAEDGSLCAVSAVCSHLGCLVHFNAAEHSWDCPCHGSRFDPEGNVLDGPASRPLAKLTPP